MTKQGLRDRTRKALFELMGEEEKEHWVYLEAECQRRADLGRRVAFVNFQAPASELQNTLDMLRLEGIQIGWVAGRNAGDVALKLEWT